MEILKNLDTSILASAIAFNSEDASFFLSWKVRHPEFPYSLGDQIYTRKTPKSKRKTKAWTISGARPSGVQVEGQEQKIMVLIESDLDNKGKCERRWMAPWYLLKCIEEGYI